MNAAQLFVNEYYAWKKSPPKGRIPLDAKKVRLRYIEQRKRSDMQNRHTMAAVTIVETGVEVTVPAREIIMFWDDYEGERDHLLAEKLEREMIQRRSQLRKVVVESMINTRLHEKGIPLHVSMVWDRSASISDITTLREWLGIDEELILTAIENQMEEEYGSEETAREMAS